MTAAVILSLGAAYLGSDISKDALPTISSSISILAGFTFTALFSSHYLTVGDLPAPENETERNDILIMTALSHNFRVRSRFFITLSVLGLLSILVLSIHLKIPTFACKPDPHLSSAFAAKSCSIGIYLTKASSIASTVIFVAMNALTLFIFLEILYTFYRLAETIMASLDRRREYIDNHKARHRKEPKG
ncbi:hypothetical protein [Sphingomonas sp.]|uniref:hypothetical protein n=1 Tax=Sphingomonas sp. TaxID=28214 RepID=UPI002FD90FD1